jgi:D-glycero-beta-D-manno-heptose 1-phosphate adenylyltransferase
MSHYQKLKSKLYSLEDLLDLVKIWKNEDQTIVFTNGCFDIIHAGHIDYLSKAADLGTKLIIAVNTDDSVSKLKGKHRPIQSELSRTMILSAMEFVNAVVLFGEETPYDLIKKIVPHVLVKGSDYKAENIVGYDIVTKNGGKVETLNFLPGFSTSAIEEKIKLS